MDKQLINFVNDTFSLDITSSSYADVKMLLSKKLNDWIINDFERLIHTLYRIDVNEKKIEQLLKENQSSDASDILADLIIERQLQKIKTRKEFKSPGSDSREERW